MSTAYRSTSRNQKRDHSHLDLQPDVSSSSRPGAFAVHSLFTILGFALQVVPGLIVKTIFDAISGETPAPAAPLGINALWWLIALYFLTQVAALFFSLGSSITGIPSGAW